MIKIADRAGLPYSKDELIQNVEKGEQYLNVAEACVDAIGPAGYRDFMEQQFDKAFKEDDIPAAYSELLGMSPKIILTTNYDRIPEVGGKGLYRVGTNNNAPEIMRSISKGHPVVMKIHGDILDQSSIVLTTSDYQRIIYSNPNTRQLLTSLLSTKTFIFLGFSLSDPHIDVILEYLKTINNNMPISHYALINEQSKFKVSSFRKKYGMNLIVYKPSDATHPEVTEFVRALNTSISSIPFTPPSLTKTIDTKESIFQYLDDKLSKETGHTSYLIWLSDNTLCISFNSVGETETEMQKEILAIINSFDFSTSVYSHISLQITKSSEPSINANFAFPIILAAIVERTIAEEYAAKKILANSLWEKIDFLNIPDIGNPFSVQTKVLFPLNRSIIGI